MWQWKIRVRYDILKSEGKRSLKEVNPMSKKSQFKERAFACANEGLKILFSFCLVAVLENVSFAKTVAVTAIKSDEKSAEITLNDAILIRDIQVIREGGLSLKFPEYISRSGRIYPQVKILTPEADETIRRAIQTGKTQGTPKLWDPKKDIKITEFRRWTHDRGFYYITEVTFGEAIAVSCRVSKGKKGVWVRWPARPPEEGARSRKWFNQVYFLDKGFQDEVEKILTQRYESEEAKVKQSPQKQPKKSAKEKLMEYD